MKQGYDTASYRISDARFLIIDLSVNILLAVFLEFAERSLQAYFVFENIVVA